MLLIDKKKNNKFNCQGSKRRLAARGSDYPTPETRFDTHRRGTGQVRLWEYLSDRLIQYLRPTWDMDASLCSDRGYTCGDKKPDFRTEKKTERKNLIAAKMFEKKTPTAE